LALRRAGVDHPPVDEPPLDRQTVDDMIRLLMRIDARLEALLDLDAEDDDEEEADS
jgi:hypothetical protein